jgi:hypothetical protein
MKRPTSAARELAAQRQRTIKRCEVCDKEILGVVQQRYCSNRCAARASRRRRRQQSESGNLVDRLNATRAAIMQGAEYPGSSADLLDEARDERVARL